jgi:hypothetical protein
MAYTAKTALLGGIIDYAGTFPPAALSLKDALKSAAGFRARARHPWLVGKLAVSLSDLKQIDVKAIYEAGGDGEPWLFAALGTTPEEPTAASFLRAVEWDLREILRYNERCYDGPCRLFVTAYETKIPVEGIADAAAAHEFTAPVLDRFASLARNHIDPHFEVALEQNGRANIGAVADALGRWAGRDAGKRVVPGLKVRTGGKFVPDAALVADVVFACTTNGLRFKATQGLHHAVTHGTSLGFVNLFATLAFAQALGEEGFSREDARLCLEEENPAKFSFGAEAFRWSEKTLTLQAIESARRLHGATFGSCSADEPDESLAGAFPQ